VADKEARRVGNAILPYLWAPGSFKRMLGGGLLTGAERAPGQGATRGPGESEGAKGAAASTDHRQCIGQGEGPENWAPGTSPEVSGGAGEASPGRTTREGLVQRRWRQIAGLESEALFAAA